MRTQDIAKAWRNAWPIPMPSPDSAPHPANPRILSVGDEDDRPVDTPVAPGQHRLEMAHGRGEDEQEADDEPDQDDGIDEQGGEDGGVNVPVQPHEDNAVIIRPPDQPY